MSSKFFEWPSQAFFGKKIPKEKFYSNTNMNSSMKKRFVDEIQQIRWAYKLSEGTLNLPGNDEVREIQVIEIYLKKETLSKAVLDLIDRTIPSAVVFELYRNAASKQQVKTISRYTSSKGIQSKGAFFESGWESIGISRVPLPAVLDLSSLFRQIQESLSDVSISTAQTPEEITNRLSQVAKLEREITGLRSKMGRESQLKKRVELKRRLTKLSKELDALRTVASE